MSQPMPYTLICPACGLDTPPAAPICLCSPAAYNASKYLSNAECAAEYWRLKADLCGFGVVTDSPVEINRKTTTMHRFATTPHAFEVDDG